MVSARSIRAASGCALAAICISAPALGDPAAPVRLEDLPITRVAVMKNGTALLVHSGSVPCDDAGVARIVGLPVPVLGSFWTSIDDPACAVRSVVARYAPAPVDRAPTDIVELLRANVGRSATLRLDSGDAVTGTIESILGRPGDAHPAPPPPPAPTPWGTTRAAPPPPPIPAQPTAIVLSTEGGMRAISIGSIRDALLPADAAMTLHEAPDAPCLDYDLAWVGARTHPDRVPVDLSYLQRGIRWIPSYRVDLASDGHAEVDLQASIVNDAIDLTAVPVDLVVGVPSFAFEDSVDPMSMRASAPPLNAFFTTNRSSMLTNAIASQSVSYRYAESGDDSESGSSPLESRGEDQFIFTVPSLTLGAGERATVPLKRFTLETRDVYRLNIPVAPPREVRNDYRDDRFAALDRAQRSPTVSHVLEFTNTTDAPITTAPVLIVGDGRPIAQSVTTYVPPTEKGEFELSTALDIAVVAESEEIGRDPNALRHDGDTYTKITISGTVTITNHKTEPVVVDVARDIIGQVIRASGDGKATAVDRISDLDSSVDPDVRWWRWGFVPWWAFSVNPVSRVTWSVPLEPGESSTVTYEFSYFWR